MADDDRSRRDDEPESDPDRAAILARRQRFIALALSGLASATACDACTPKPCLNVAEPMHPDDEKDGADAKAEPHPCLSAIPDPTEAKPTPCLSPPQPDAKDQKPTPTAKP